MAITLADPPQIELSWRPNPGQQEFALRIPPIVFEILYGGARGGGKTDAGIYWLIKRIGHPHYTNTYLHPLYRALVLRRNADDLSDWLDRAERVYSQFGARLIRTPHPRFVFPSGAVIRCGHLKDKEAYTKYQGHEYQRMLIEELTQIPDEKYYDKVVGSCRSTVFGIPAQIFLTSNPGGKGHAWVRKRFVKAAAPNTMFTNESTGRPAIYVPARVEDNPVLMTADPQYVKWLEALRLRDINLWKAWRQGDWDAFEGQAFSEWRDQLHTVTSFGIDLRLCRKIAALDWGYNDPTSVHWLAQTPESSLGVRRIYVYRELHKNQRTPLEWADLLGTIFKYEPVEYLVLPHDCFSNVQGYQSVAQVFAQHFREMGLNVVIKRAESLNKGSRPRRVTLMHQMLSIAPDGIPYMQVHVNNRNLIQTLPELVYSEDNPEDIDTDQDDHSYDSVSYGLMTLRPQFQRSRLVNTQPPLPTGMPQTWAPNPQGQIPTGDILRALATQQQLNMEPEA